MSSIETISDSLMNRTLNTVKTNHYPQTLDLVVQTSDHITNSQFNHEFVILFKIVHWNNRTRFYVHCLYNSIPDWRWTEELDCGPVKRYRGRRRRRRGVLEKPWGPVLTVAPITVEMKTLRKLCICEERLSRGLPFPVAQRLTTDHWPLTNWPPCWKIYEKPWSRNAFHLMGMRELFSVLQGALTEWWATCLRAIGN